MILSPVPTLRRKKGTEKLAPVTCAHAATEEGHREACSCHLCPRCGRRRVQEGVRRITAKIKTVICEQAPNHGSYFAYAQLIARVSLNLHVFDLPVDGVYAMFFQEIIRLAERSAAKESAVRR